MGRDSLGEVERQILLAILRQGGDAGMRRLRESRRALQRLWEGLDAALDEA